MCKQKHLAVVELQELSTRIAGGDIWGGARRYYDNDTDKAINIIISIIHELQCDTFFCYHSWDMFNFFI